MARRFPKRAEGRVRELTQRGEAVVETPDGLVRAAFGVPGERVRVGRIRKQGGWWRGRIERVLEPAPERVEPACPIHARCGGCPLMHLAPEAQRAHKLGALRGALARAGAEHIEPAWVEAESRLAYRRRTRLAFSGRGSGTLGYRGFRSHRLVDVSACAVLEPALEEALGMLRARWKPALEGEGEIHLARGEGGRPVAWLRSEAPQPPAVYEAARRLVDEGAFAGVALGVGGATAEARFGDPDERMPGWDGDVLVVPGGGFAQANAAVNYALVSHVHRWAEARDARVLELYAGHGNLTVALAREAAEMTAVERDPASAEACRANLAARGLDVSVQCAEAGAASRGPPVDVVVLDPPREGARETLEGVSSRRPRRIVYASCEPATLGRDLAALAAEGYRVRAASAFDMFPQTAHVEALVQLEATLPGGKPGAK